jgi:hypothetical protein
MTDNDSLAEALIAKSAYLEIHTCTGQATHLQTPNDAAFSNWATYSDILLTGGELADIRLDELFEPQAHWIRCALVVKSELEPDWLKAVVLADVFLACPHTIQVDHDQSVQSRLILPTGVKV